LYSILVWLFGLPTKVRHLSSGFAKALMAFTKALRDKEAIITDEHLLKYLTRIDPHPYLRLLEFAPSELRSRLFEALLPLPFGRAKLAAINAEYERICLGVDSPLPLTNELDIFLSRDAFYGTGWRIPRRFPARQIGVDGAASIFLRLPQGQAFHVQIDVSKIPFELGSYLRLEVNGQLLWQQGVELASSWQLWGVISPHDLTSNSGRTKLTMRLTNEKGKPRDDAFIGRVRINPFASPQESIFAQLGLCSELYLSFIDAGVEYHQVYRSCPPSAEADERQAEVWISALNRSLSSEILPSRAALRPTEDVSLSDHINGYGWGRAGYWGAQSFRRLGSGGASSIFLKLRSSQAYILKAYVYTCPQDALSKLRLRVNGNDLADQGLRWEEDRYYLWVKVPAIVGARDNGVVELSIFVEGNDCAPEGIQGSLPSAKMNCSNIAFSRIAIVEHNTNSTSGSPQRLSLSQRGKRALKRAGKRLGVLKV